MKKYVIIILVLVFGTSICSNYMTYKATNSKNKISENSSPQNTLDTVNNVLPNETFEEETISNIETENTAISDEQQKVEEKTPVENTDIKFSISKNTVSSIQSSAGVQQEKTEIKNNNNTPQATKDESIQKQPEVPKQNVVEEQPVILGEEYKTNDTMINTIKSVIESNESEDMQLYGYSIVVDSSIIETTSQFTYTKQRVIDKIKYKFGTIKIYARDYYNNGQFICTQCYII